DPDGKVDFNDLQVFCQQWLNEGDGWSADLNHDEVVDNGDLSHFAKNWYTFHITDTFDDSSSLAHWTIVDEGTKSGPSAWQVLDGQLYEPSNIYGPAASNVELRKGTYVYWNDPAAMAWTDYEFEVTLRTTDNDGTGVMFRYQNTGTYYKLDMDCERGFRKLFKMLNGTETLLASAAGGYTQNALTQIRVNVIGNQIYVLHDGVNVFGGPITDSDIPVGTIALYDWGCTGMYFDNFSAYTTHIPPGATDDIYQAQAGQILNAASVLDNDTLRTDVIAELVTAPQHGQIQFRQDGTFDYTPDADFGGNERFTYRIVRGEITCTARVTIKVDTPNSFSLVILPDTQKYSLDYPAIYTSQTTWIAGHRDPLKLAFVLHEGDITHTRTTAEWDNASASMSVLDAAQVPYAIAMGNHDQPNAAPRDTSLFNTYFPVSRYENCLTFGGVYEANHMENSWHTFTAGGIDWLVFVFEFGPRDAVLSWANGIIAAHPHHRIIVVTHAYMYDDDTRLGDGDSWNPNNYNYCSSYDCTCNDGDEMWNNFIKLHKNMTFVFSGHVLHDGTGRRVDTGDHGNRVYQMLANFQMNASGGEGFLRIVKCFPESGNVTVESYSPYIHQYKTAPDHQFEFTGVDLSVP
ncbi:MAG: Ig-like domain-containing protein, partial [Anaerohalosphaeraceae bacterium]